LSYGFLPLSSRFDQAFNLIDGLDVLPVPLLSLVLAVLGVWFTPKLGEMRL